MDSVSATAPNEDLELFRAIVTTRACEERLTALQAEGAVGGEVYPSLGQEAGPVGCAAALDRRTDGSGDLMAPSVRDAGALFMMGLTPTDYFRHFLGTRSGPGGGRDSDLQFTDRDLGIVGGISPLGSMVGVVAGMTLAARMQGDARVGMVFCGDGSSATGSWHEGLVIATVSRCALVLVVEANQWAFSTRTREHTRLHSFAGKAAGYGASAESVDGNDVFAVRAAARRAVSAARNGEGVRILELRTYRRLGHTTRDDGSYMDVREVEEWARRDPLERFRAGLVARGAADSERLAGIEATCREEVEEAEGAALEDLPPEPASALAGVYADGGTTAPWTRAPTGAPAAAETGE